MKAAIEACLGARLVWGAFVKASIVASLSGDLIREAINVAALVNTRGSTGWHITVVMKAIVKALDAASHSEILVRAAVFVAASNNVVIASGLGTHVVRKDV